MGADETERAFTIWEAMASGHPHLSSGTSGKAESPRAASGKPRAETADRP